MGQKPNWSQKELSYLKERWGSTSVKGIAKKLGRTVSAVQQKACRMGLGPASIGGDYITLNQLIIAVRGGNGGGGYIVESWCRKRGLPYHEKRIVTETVRVVYLDEFWKWAERNRSYIDFSKFEPFALGKEPAWVKEQRKKDRQGFAIQRKDPWTQEEDSRLIMLLKQHKYGYAALSEMLHRSAGAILRRCMDLGLKERPVKADNHGEKAKWGEEQCMILAEGIRCGESYCAIARRLGKFEKAVRGKVYKVYLTEDADKVRSMLGNGVWGDGRPVPTVRQAVHLNGAKGIVKELLGQLVGVLYRRTMELKKVDYDCYFQRKVCEKWDEMRSMCTAGGTDCDACAEFKRIQPQFCARCGETFFERAKNRVCPACRLARKKAAQRKYMKLYGENARRRNI